MDFRDFKGSILPAETWSDIIIENRRARDEAQAAIITRRFEAVCSRSAYEGTSVVHLECHDIDEQVRVAFFKALQEAGYQILEKASTPSMCVVKIPVGGAK